MPDRGNSTVVKRKQQILEALAAMLEETPDTRITTAKLAASVGVSEAALYRHFPSKTKMFEALITFAADTLFARIGRLSEQQASAITQATLGAMAGTILAQTEKMLKLQHEAFSNRVEVVEARMSANERGLKEVKSVCGSAHVGAQVNTSS